MWAGREQLVHGPMILSRSINLRILRFKRLASRVWHSHIVITDHLSVRSNLAILRSRRTLRENLRSQYCVWVFGITECPHPCRCQKHPCTKITLRYSVRTKSGVPASCRTLPRKRHRKARSTLRTASSGVVFFRRTLCIIRRRVAAFTVSIRYNRRYLANETKSLSGSRLCCQNIAIACSSCALSKHRRSNTPAITAATTIWE